MISYTKVYEINGRLVVAKNINTAIAIYNEYYPYQEITRIELINNSDSLFTDALIKEKDQ